VRHADSASVLLDSDVNRCASPPMNRTDWRPSACKPAQAEHADGLKVTVGVMAYGGKQVQRLGSRRASRDLFKWSPRAATRDHPKSPASKRWLCGWRDARRVEDLQVLWRDVAGEAGKWAMIGTCDYTLPLMTSSLPNSTSGLEAGDVAHSSQS